MSGLTSAIDIAASASQAFEQGIATVSQNISNETTPGYATEQATTSTLVGYGDAIGEGVQTTVTRAGDGFAAGVLRTATGANAAAGVLQTAYGALSAALANSGDVESAVNQFALDLGTLAGNPTSTAQRQTTLADGQSLTSTFQRAASSLTAVQQSATTALANNVTQANGLLSQLATINHSLSQSPNNATLLDQQEAALQSLSSVVQFSTIPMGNSGQVMVAAGGTMLLNQGGAQALAIQTGTNGGPPSITVGSGAQQLATSPSDSAIGANIASWTQSDVAQQGLNALASSFVGQINAVQAQGMTATGSAGAALFSVPAPTVVSNTGNTGTAAITATVTNPAGLSTSGSRYSLTFSTAKGWSATNQASGTSYALGFGNSLSLPGVTLSVSGAPAANDGFTLDTSPGAAANMAMTATQTSAIAAADPYAVTAGEVQSDGSIVNSNGGTVTAGAASVTTSPSNGTVVLPQSAAGQPLQLVFTSPTNFNVTTIASPGTVLASGSLSGTNSGATIAIPYGSSSAAAGSYWQVPISGTAATGDVLSFTQGGSGNGSNAQRMQSLWTQTNTGSGTSMQQSFLTMTTSLGAQAQQATTTQGQTSAQVTTATTNLQSVAGVNLNQQAVMLTQYQQAFQASAQVISSARAMFQTLLQAV